MFTDNGPGEATAKLQDYLILNMGAIPANAQEKLLPIARERSPVDTIVKGVELLYSALLQTEMPNPQDGWNALGSAAIHLGNSNYHGKSARGYELANYANFKLEDTEGDANPAVPELADEYRIVPKPPAAEPANGASFIPANPAPAQPLNIDTPVLGDPNAAEPTPPQANPSPPG